MSCQSDSAAACGCCEGPRILTPREIANRPGLSELSVRIGTHGSFLETMLARLASQDFPILRELTTRNRDDAAIALLDAGATVLDVLTFYTERIANEGYLRTATERRSVLELARLVGYRPRPGVAASVFLSFTLDPGAEVEIPPGQPARSIPAPGTTDLPQTFETSRRLKARAELNRMRPRMSLPQEITQENVLNLETIWLAGTALNLKPNDLLVFSFPDDDNVPVLRTVRSVNSDHANKRTGVTLQLDRLSVPFFLQQIASGIAAIKRNAGFDIAVRATSEGKLFADANTFADGLLTALKEPKNLVKIDNAVASALTTKVVGTQTGKSFELVAKAIRFLAQSATDLLVKSGQAQQSATAARNAFRESLVAAAGAFTADLAALNEFLVSVPISPPLNPTQQNAAQFRARTLESNLKNEQIRTAVLAVVTATPNFATALSDLRKFAPDPGTLGTLDPVLTKIVDTGEVPITPVVTLVFGPGGSAAPTLRSIVSNPPTVEFGAALGELIHSVSVAFDKFSDSLSEGVLALDSSLNIDRALPPIKSLVQADGIQTPRDAFSVAQSKLIGVIISQTDRATRFDDNFGALAQPATTQLGLFEAFIEIDRTIHGLRESLTRLRQELITRGTTLLRRYSFLGRGLSGAVDVSDSLGTVKSAFDKAATDLADAEKDLANDLNFNVGALVALFGTDEDELLAKPLAVIKRKLLSTTLKPTLSQTLRRLRAEIRGLINEVTVEPSPAQTAAVDVSSVGGGLDQLRGEIASLHVNAPIDPLAVRRELKKIFQADGQRASDGVAHTVARLSGGSEDEFFAVWRGFRIGEPEAKIHVLRQKTAVFGNNAPRGEDFGKATSPNLDARFLRPEGKTDWSPRTIDLTTKIAFESEFPQITEGGFIAIQRPDGPPTPYRIKSTKTSPRSVYGITGKSTEIELDEGIEWGKDYEPPLFASISSIPVEQGVVGRIHSSALATHDAKRLPLFDLIRRTVVFVQSEELTFADAPVERGIGPNPAGGGDLLGEDEKNEERIMLDDLYQGIDAGHWLIVSGERADGISGTRVNELARVARVEHVYLTSSRENKNDKSQPIARSGDAPHTRIVLSERLKFSYKRETVEIFGNVIDATHGERREEVPGNGDARLPFQTFELKQPPITHTAAPTVAGAESTLRVRVNDVLWHEVESFEGLEPGDRRFITETGDDGKTRVVFGNGLEGARLPTGSGNVKALYRNGLGKPGNVKAGAISQLTSKPHGLKEVINPLRASGGADRETRDQIRRNAPLATMALQRLVSVQDYEDFAQTFAGIGKASAVRLSDPAPSFVHVTVAGVDDIPIDEESELFKNFSRTLGEVGDPRVRVKTAARELVLLVLVANVKVQAGHLWKTVKAKLLDVLLREFGFEHRALGQTVFLSEVLSVMQAVEGVDHVDVDRFGGIPEKQAGPPGSSPALLERMPLSPVEIAAQIGVIAEEKPKQTISADLAALETHGKRKTLRPAQLAIFSLEVADTIVLQEKTTP